MIGPVETGLKLHAPSNTWSGGNRTQRERLANQTGHDAARSAVRPRIAEIGLDVKTIKIAARIARLTNTMIRLVTRVRPYANVSRFSTVPDSYDLG